MDWLLQQESILLVLFVGTLASVHLIADRVPLGTYIKREYWLSAAAGISTVYVFVFLLPKVLVVVHQNDVIDSDQQLLALVFLGLVLFFAIERIARVAKHYQSDCEKIDLIQQPVFWLHILAFSSYNLVIGYTVISGQIIEERIPFTAAMTLHLFAIDEGLRDHHRDPYHRKGRWFLAGSIIAGALVGTISDVGIPTLTILIAILSGGIIFNAIKEELPSDRKSSVTGFVAGAGLFVFVVWLISMT